MWKIRGQDHILRQIEPSLKLGQPAHAYLLVGPPHVGKMTLALDLAQALNCSDPSPAPCGDCTQCTRIAQGQHADVRVVEIGQGAEDGPTRTVIGINDIKDVLHQVNLKPYEGKFTVIIFNGAEAMSDEAANALLKTLEEPPGRVLFLLLTADEEALLTTIRSRCRPFRLLPVPKTDIERQLESEHSSSSEESERLARLSRGCLGWAITAGESPQVLEEHEARLDRFREVYQAGLDQRFAHASEIANIFSRDREAARQVLYSWLRWWRDLLLIKEGSEDYLQNSHRLDDLRLTASGLNTVETVDFIKLLLETLEALDSNASPRLALEVLMLKLPGANVSA
ncbi:MAG: hypothetical protein BZY88_09185 [SAR202 cluster bacterium Io17-Chloro-G9]|nr:MAG: hypothetical protein BZY88_09185 [SAR202 cluster bacterium Io17-Chloro-G9]